MSTHAGQYPDPYLVAFELLLYGLLLLCVRHAWRTGGLPRVWQLVAGIAFGVLLELGTIQQLHAYAYGRFLIMLGEAPLAVGVGWGIIIYAAQLFSNATSLPLFLRPLLDALLALNIDLAMDAVAIRLGMWHWGIDTTAQWFGVPYANFGAWFWVVFSFSTGVRLFGYRDDWVGRWLAPVAGIVIGVVVVLSANALMVGLIPVPFHLSTVAVIIGSALALVLLARPVVYSSSVPPAAGWVPLGFHLYFLIAGLLAGVFRQIPFLLFVSALMLLVAFWLHRPGKLVPREYVRTKS